MIVDFYSKQQTDIKLSEKANSSDVYSKSQTYNKTEIDSLVTPVSIVSNDGYYTITIGGN